jgi:hypothetical protein
MMIRLHDQKKKNEQMMWNLNLAMNKQLTNVQILKKMRQQEQSLSFVYVNEYIDDREKIENVMKDDDTNDLESKTNESQDFMSDNRSISNINCQLCR